MPQLTDNERGALERLIAHARHDSGQSRHVADFLLSWWNAGTCGGFDMTTMWECDDELIEDMLTVFGFVGRTNVYPDTLGYKKDFEEIVREWRPELTA